MSISTPDLYEKHIFICVNERVGRNERESCAKCGGMEIRMRFVKLINKHGLKGVVRANKSGCLDVCELGPVVVIYPDGAWYTNVQLHDVDENQAELRVRFFLSKGKGAGNDTKILGCPRTPHT